MINASPKLSFLLDDKSIDWTLTDPNRTILQFLREDLKLTGSKEGCAEGDCGACSVVLYDGESYYTINSCIAFLPILDGKQLITVEHLAEKTGLASQKLHPVQQALVEHHGSQCGFCTPGFVMSLFALGKNQTGKGLITDENKRYLVQQAIAGNLCRCTGYQPIIDAGVKAISEPWSDSFQQYSAETKQKIARLKPTTSKWFQTEKGSFFSPVNMTDLQEYLQKNPDNALYVNGGTDVGLWVTKRFMDLPNIIYLGNLTELSRIEKTPTALLLGGNLTVAAALESLVNLYPALKPYFSRFAATQIRNLATVAGNICNASPIGDLSPLLLAIDAEISYGLPQGLLKKAKLSEFFLDYRKTLLGKNELLQAITIPITVKETYANAFKVSKRNEQDISSVSMGFYFEEPSQNRLKNVRVAFGGLASTPKRASAVENLLNGQSVGLLKEKKAIRTAIEKDFQPISDMRASAEYRLEVAQNLLLKQGSMLT